VNPRSLARAFFVLLVLATGAAFFITQRLKSGEPVVKRLALQKFFSPNDDGRKDRALIAFDLPKGDRVTVDVVNRNGDRIRRLIDGASFGRGGHRLGWDGRADDGTVPPDGTYFVRVTLRRQGRAATGARGIELVTTPPEPRLVSVSPSWVSLRRPVPITIRYTGPSVVPPVYGIWRTDRLPPKRVAVLKGDRQTHTIRWDGRIRGRLAPAGRYAVSVSVQNRALIEGTSPARLPPTRRLARPRTGFTIGGATVAPPLEPVRAGAVASFDIYGGSARVAWRFDRLGAGGRPLDRGRNGTAPLKPKRLGPSGAPSTTSGPRRRLEIRIPRRARTGVHMLTVAAGGRPVRVPVVVRRGSTRVLVVVPTIEWQGTNPIDDDADGFSDTLYRTRAIPLGRPFAGGTPPARLGSQVGPLLRYLDGARIPYELTTDLALARDRGPRLAGYPGVALGGDVPWLTPGLAAGLRGYVQAGGQVASFGAASLRRRVSVTPTVVARATPPASVNALGEVTRVSGGPAGSLTASTDELGLFTGTDGVAGPFEVFEQSVRLPRGARALTAAGRAPGKAAFVAYRLGRGLVIRVGTPQWAAGLTAGSTAATVTEGIWARLSR
jgi:N,N-dimethylformamidase beta subunit-like, C-terminal/FlgD Ig-like domain